MAEANKVAVVIGVGPGIGLAVAKKFSAAGFAIGLVSRDLEKLKEYQKTLLTNFPTIKTAVAAADTANEGELKVAFANLRETIGHPSVLVYNAGAVFKRASVLDLTADDLLTSYNRQVVGALVSVKEVLPHMLSVSQGTIIFTGATAQTKGSALFASFSTAKFALRAFAQSLAREVQPKGIHVAIVSIDGLVNDTGSRKMFPDLPEEKFISPQDVAETYYYLHLQHKSAWTHELDLRPHLENW
eukprot:TRINITY_DN3027_c0_g1_i1.p1 TRINITY_DN3027_c0_g1~~TRINITY_DN3027_c0_g1_i1.p1  ORF type:complete len:267 (+),score=31.31 TRINITY_DN3027_c0_g1_i1:74-802(+)